eukprot:4943157-Pyramimonas_sp.AAC.1
MLGGSRRLPEVLGGCRRRRRPGASILCPLSPRSPLSSTLLLYSYRLRAVLSPRKVATPSCAWRLLGEEAEVNLAVW